MCTYSIVFLNFRCILLNRNIKPVCLFVCLCYHLFVFSTNWSLANQSWNHVIVLKGCAVSLSPNLRSHSVQCTLRSLSLTWLSISCSNLPSCAPCKLQRCKQESQARCDNFEDVIFQCCVLFTEHTVNKTMSCDCGSFFSWSLGRWCHQHRPWGHSRQEVWLRWNQESENEELKNRSETNRMTVRETCLQSVWRGGRPDWCSDGGGAPPAVHTVPGWNILIVVVSCLSSKLISEKHFTTCVVVVSDFLSDFSRI